MLFDAATLARGWLSVNHAAANTQDRPALYKTVHIDQYPHGMRLVATDGYLLLGTWVPNKDTDLGLDAAEPELDELPYASATAVDQHGRGAGLLAHLLKLAGSDDHKGEEATVHLNVPWQPEEHGEELQLEGLEAHAVVIEQPDRERVQLEVYEGPYPNWQTVAAKSRGRSRGSQVALAAWITARLAKAAKIHDDLTPIRYWVAKELEPVAVQFGVEPTVVGLVMPVRWDFDRNAPFGEDEETP